MSDSNSSHQSVYNQLLSLIPETLPDNFRLNPKDFSRNRDLTFPELISLLLSTSASDKDCGLLSKIPEFFKNAKRSGILPLAKSCVPAAVRRARAKVPWQVFEDIFYNATDLANSLCTDQPLSLWNGLSVYAIDGSKYSLPADDKIRAEFDKNSGFDKRKGHYPQCLVSTAYDVFRRFPIAYTIAPNHASEREEAKLLLAHLPHNGVALLDRGYPSYELISTFLSQYNGFCIFRCCSKNTFPVVEQFIRSKKSESQIDIKPTLKYLIKCTVEQKALARPIRLRVIRMESPDGTVSVLLTNLFDKSKYSAKEIINIYYERYRIEEYYRHEKVIVGVEKFHSKSPNGIRQELYANAIISVISRILMQLTYDAKEKRRIEPQFKHTVLAFAREAFLLTPGDPQSAVVIFKELLNQIASVKYYRPQRKRNSYPRISKKPPNKWCDNRSRLIEKPNEFTL